VTWIIFLFFPELRNIYGALVQGVLTVLYCAVGENLTVRPTQRVTNNMHFAKGNQQIFAVCICQLKKGPQSRLKKGPLFLRVFQPFDRFFCSVTFAGQI
jgi:hypothetical protein